ncbi:MAG: PAS domain S-box protein [Fibrobacter sp.]|nr:PAS domain S-box protein [Fibrobacter sp.]
MNQALFKTGRPILLYTIMYFFAYQVAFLFPDARSLPMTIWPAGGIALAALILNPFRLWKLYIPVFFIAAVAANMLLAQIPFSAGIGFALSNILKSFFCALFIRTFSRSSSVTFSRFQEVACLIVCAFVINALISLLEAATSFYFSGTSFSSAWIAWYIADLLGILLITPFVVSFARANDLFVIVREKKLIESAAFLLIWTLSSILIFVTPTQQFHVSLHPYMLIALLLWPAFRLRLQIVSLAMITLTIIAFTGNNMNQDFFLDTFANGSNFTLNLQVFLAFTAIMGYFFSASGSERHITEDKNRESEKRYKSLFDQTSEGLMIMSKDLIILEVNDAFAKMHGYSINELIGQHISILDVNIPPDKQIDPDFVNIIEDKKVAYFEVSHRHSNGHIFPLRATSSTIQIGTESFYLTFHHDITEQRKIEDALKERTQFTESLLKISPDSIYMYDLIKKTITYSNDGIINILGYNVDEIQQMGPLILPQLMHPDDYKRYLAVTIKKYSSLKENEITGSQIRMLHKDGNYRWLQANEIVYRRLDNGEPEQIFGVIHNITEMKEKEQQLEENDYFFRESQRVAGIGSYKLYIKDDHWVASDAFYQVLGIDKNYPVTTQGLIDLVHPDDITMMRDYLFQEVIERHKLFNKEYRIIRFSDKETRWISNQGKIVLDSDGTPLYLIGTTQDITERKNSEAILQKSQKLESLGILAGGIAHDFNNLMGGIFGYIDIAISTSNDNSVQKYLSKALSTIDRAKELTSRLLTFAKGGAPIQKVMPLFPFVQETVQFALSGSSVKSSFTIAHDLRNCNIDKDQIAQVIDNIVINAVQAMPKGGEINVTAENVSLKDKEVPTLDAGTYVRISIQDHGIGIEKENLHKLFVPFYTTKPTGHGLGLATSYSIIHRHHGTIEVNSEAGSGTTVYIYIPATAVMTITESAESAAHNGHGLFIVMDDEEVMRDTITVMLEKLGYEVVSTIDGLQTIDTLKKLLPDKVVTGILLDLTIPGGMGGRETLIAIRKFITTIPVFVVSGYADDPIMKDPSQFGFSGSICKPFRKAELTSMLERYNNKQHSGASPV